MQKPILCDGDTFTHENVQFRINTPYDEGQRLPWEFSDCHGPVSEWTKRDKRPGELILAHDRHEKLFYDFQAACKIARKEWGLKTRKAASDSAREDYEYLRRFCNDQWSYIRVVVTLLDDDGDDMPYSASIWGVESDAHEYIESLAHELAAEIIAKIQETLAA